MKQISFFLLLFLNYSISMAQCAMCKANAEQSLNHGAEDANWLNYGIVLMMSVPFFFFITVYLLFKRNNKE
jgi:hypothetical protein